MTVARLTALHAHNQSMVSVQPNRFGDPSAMVDMFLVNRRFCLLLKGLIAIVGVSSANSVNISINEPKATAYA